MSKESHKIEDRIMMKKACHEACVESLSILYQKYRKPVCDFLHKAGAGHLTEDICQSVFIRILDEKCKYNGSGGVKSYLFGIARNIHNQEILSQKISVLSQNQVEVVGDLIIAKKAQPYPVEAIGTLEMAQIIEKRAGQLPAKARQAVELVYLAGIPAKKASEVAQCDLKVFCERLEYGLKLLQKSFDRKKLNSKDLR